MLARKLMCTNLFEGVEGGFPLWHQMGLGKMNHTFEETHNKAVPEDPLDPLLRKWVKCLKILLQDILQKLLATQHSKI
jgi:hypothetical protein